MYDPPGGAVLGGGLGVGGSLAVTGFSVMFAVTVAVALILVGAVLFRRATVQIAGRPSPTLRVDTAAAAPPCVERRRG